ncbi:50S ribosomal protein L33 [Candidatus Babeliales bacterium]|nr:50S ribosomal protein L33 [Candidatus Babeliales bacterium]
MAKNRIILHLACSICKDRNYQNRVAKKRITGKLVLNKYCPKCREHKEHRETK